MDDVIGQRAFNKLDAGRQCTATSKQTGERCKRAPIVGGFVCDLHGGKIPAVRKSARERLLAMVDPALDALLRALKTGPPCEHCGRSDADKDPVVIRAAQIVLDRCGYHPTVSIVRAEAPNPFEDFTVDETVAELERLLDTAKAMRDRQQQLTCAVDAAVVDEGFEVDDSAPIQEPAVPFPEGNETADDGKEAK